MADLSGSINRYSSVPFHQQLRTLLEEEITSGRWTAGHRLPSEPFLTDYYGVSRSTVRQALLALQQQGLIRKEKGRGAFVARSIPGSWLLQSVGGLFDDEISRRGIVVESTVLRAAVEVLPEWATEALRLDRETQGVFLERLRRVDGEIALYVLNHLPSDYADVLNDVRGSPRASLYGALRERLQVEIAGSSRMLEAVPAPDHLARHLGVPRKSPLVFIQSVTWDSTGKPIDCYRAWLRTDRLRIAVETQTWASSAGRVVSHSVREVPNDGLSVAAN
jgi:GntR family transcriptional regulator